MNSLQKSHLFSCIAQQIFAWLKMRCLNWIFILTNVKKLPELAFLQDLLAQAPGFVMIFLGEDYRFAFTNKEVEVMLGGMDVIGLSIKELAPEPLRKDIVGRLDSVWKTGKPFMARELPYRAFINNGPDFKIRYADFLHHPIRDKEGEIIGIYVQGTDVTERKHFHENLALLKQQSVSVVRDIVKMIERSVDEVLSRESDTVSAEMELQRRFDLLVEVQASFIDMQGLSKDIEETIRNALSLMVADISAISIKGDRVALSALYQPPLILLIQGLIHDAIDNNIELKNINIYWRVLDNNMLNIVWREQRLNSLHDTNGDIDNSLIYRLININPNNNLSTLQEDGVLEYNIDICLDV